MSTDNQEDPPVDSTPPAAVSDFDAAVTKFDADLQKLAGIKQAMDDAQAESGDAADKFQAATEAYNQFVKSLQADKQAVIDLINSLVPDVS